MEKCTSEEKKTFLNNMTKQLLPNVNNIFVSTSSHKMLIILHVKERSL